MKALALLLSICVAQLQVSSGGSSDGKLSGFKLQPCGNEDLAVSAKLAKEPFKSISVGVNRKLCGII